MGGQRAWVAEATAGEAEEALRGQPGAPPRVEKGRGDRGGSGCAAQQPVQAESPSVEPGEESCPPAGLCWSPGSRP